MLALLSLILPAVAWAQIPAAPAQPPQAGGGVTPFVRNTIRVEHWRFFEPRAGGGDPVYTTFGFRLLAGVRQTRPRFEWIAAAQYVQFGGLPERSIGPGPLGTGATYFDHQRDTNPGHVYLRLANLQVRNVLPGLHIRGGRMPYTSGAEAPSGDAAIEAVKRQRLDSRLVGEFEWSMYQRTFDGARVDWRAADRVHVTASALWPTQGGFEAHAGASLADVRVTGGTVDLLPSASLLHTQLQGFVFAYDDTREVTARPDNTFRPAAAADISLRTFGGSIVGVYPTGAGRLDALGWFALQRGDWYDASHRATAFALEAGHQWTGSPWAPWLRAGWNRASGDGDPGDDEHATFLPMLPTARKYALSATYTFMNLDDRFAQILARPHARVSLRADVHHLRLVEDADLWYAGSGATRREGTIFGYAGRRSGGNRTLGTIVEGAVDVNILPQWSVNAYAGWMRGGDVVRSLFAENRLTFAYLENVLQF
jgi:hypothetical protein